MEITALKNKLDSIYNDIESSKSISLLGGGPGIILFKLYYLKHIKQNDLAEIEADIQEFSEFSLNNNRYPSFCSGQAGLNWFFNFLFKQGYIEKGDYELIGSTDFVLAKASLEYLKRDCYDFLHGAVGIAHHLVYTKKRALKPFLGELLDGIIKLMGKENPVLHHFDFDSYSLANRKINPSLSHGMTSVLKLCLECYQNKIYKRKSKFIAKNILNFLLSNVNSDHSYSYFPYVYDSDNNENQQSRLSWCYGDLTIAYVMRQYGILFEDQTVEKKAMEILYHSSMRRKDESGIVDAGFCHGTAGVAYIFNKLWHSTKDTVFQDASQYWLQKTIDYPFHQDGLAGYKKYDHLSKEWVNDSGLLEGVAGIGLTIISCLFQDYSWDYCLMLNDC